MKIIVLGSALVFFVIVFIIAGFLGESGTRDTPLNGIEYHVLEALSQKDFSVLSTFVHPAKGVRFSPYASIDRENDLTFGREEIAGAMDREEVLEWGIHDGSGEPIAETFSDYFHRFVWDHDYRKAEQVSYDEVTNYGNSINTIRDVYTTERFVEFYFPGFDPQYEGMDWRALTLVFEKLGDRWVLVGIVHAEWTI